MRLHWPLFRHGLRRQDGQPLSVGGDAGRRAAAHAHRALLRSSTQEGPDLDGLGKERPELERMRMDSESLDEEDS